MIDKIFFIIDLSIPIHKYSDVFLKEYFTTESPASAKCYGAAGAFTEGFSFFAHPAGGGTMGKKNTAQRDEYNNNRKTST